MNIDREAVRWIVEEVIDRMERGGALRADAAEGDAAGGAGAGNLAAAERGGALRDTTAESMERTLVPGGASDHPAGSGAHSSSPHGTRVIVTVLGRNRPGIAAGITGAISEIGGDVLDMSQTILGEFFAMIVIVGFRGETVDFGVAKERLIRRGLELGVRVVAQHEDVFRYMHRI